MTLSKMISSLEYFSDIRAQFTSEDTLVLNRSYESCGESVKWNGTFTNDSITITKSVVNGAGSQLTTISIRNGEIQKANNISKGFMNSTNELTPEEIQAGLKTFLALSSIEESINNYKTTLLSSTKGFFKQINTEGVPSVSAEPESIIRSYLGL